MVLCTTLYPIQELIRDAQLYITHSEWASEDAFSASAGSKNRAVPGANFRRLPFNFCAISLQPFSHPVCTANGTIFDLTHILPWLKKHGTNPTDGSPLKRTDLIKLNFQKNEDGEYIDPVTFKPLTDHSHLVALRNTGNVFLWDTVQRLNIKPKNWRDLVSDAEFSKNDIITLQDPQNLSARDLSSFKYLNDGESTLTDDQKRARADPANNINQTALGSSARVLKAQEAVAKARAERAETKDPNRSALTRASNGSSQVTRTGQNGTSQARKPAPPNAARHTTGQAAASFTSTGVTPYTGNELALLSEEEYLLHPRRVKNKGYARMQTTQGALNIELDTEFAPRAVWNFVHLAKKGYYDNVSFHRNIRRFMIQGGDPSGTGRGGSSIWGQPFKDEFGQSPLRHTKRGVLSMANKGRNTNTSQFFVTYDAAAHLDNKHTIFGRVIDEGEAGVESVETLDALEAVPTDEKDTPLETCEIEEVSVFVDPFEEFKQQNKDEELLEARRQAEIKEKGGLEDDLVTWTGKRVKRPGQKVEDAAGVGKYLTAKQDEPEDEIIEEVVEYEQPAEEPPPKKRKRGGFGNFDAW